MTASIPVDRITQILNEAGYRSEGPSVPVASIPFDFAAILTGGDRALDLVVVIDTIAEPSEGRLLKKIAGLTKALDMVGSRRSVTAVVVGPSPSAGALQAMGRQCRVLVVGTPTGADANRSVRDCIAVLLPLDLPPSGTHLADPMALVRRELGRNNSTVAARLMLAAPGGAARVEQEFDELLKEVLPPDDGPLL